MLKARTQEIVLFYNTFIFTRFVILKEKKKLSVYEIENIRTVKKNTRKITNTFVLL